MTINASKDHVYLSGGVGAVESVQDVSENDREDRHHHSRAGCAQRPHEHQQVVQLQQPRR